MNAYDSERMKIRPEIQNLVIQDNMTIEEKFQNRTLRPILKVQHELIVLRVNDFVKLKKNTFYKLPIEKRADYIKQNLLGDKMIIHELRALVSGLFTLEETKYYLQNKSTINKRMQSLLLQRISSFLLVE